MRATMFRTPSRGGTAAALLVAVLLASGCGGADEEPAPAADPGTGPEVTFERAAQEFDVPPRPLTQVQPEFPDGVTAGGRVLVELTVGADGTVMAGRVAGREGSEAFEVPALEAIRQWTFAPATLEGEPVAVTIMVPVVFERKPPTGN